jgi:hypothetical protein
MHAAIVLLTLAAGVGLLLTTIGRVGQNDLAFTVGLVLITPFVVTMFVLIIVAAICSLTDHRHMVNNLTIHLSNIASAYQSTTMTEKVPFFQAFATQSMILGEERAQLLRALVEALQDQTHDPFIRYSAACALGELGEAELPSREAVLTGLLAATTDLDAGVRGAARLALEKIQRSRNGEGNSTTSPR